MDLDGVPSAEKFEFLLEERSVVVFEVGVGVEKGLFTTAEFYFGGEVEFGLGFEGA